MKVIGVKNTKGDADFAWHAKANVPGNYHTLCGLSLDDDELTDVPAERGQKIDCTNCKAYWLEAKRFRKSDFEP